MTMRYVDKGDTFLRCNQETHIHFTRYSSCICDGAKVSGSDRGSEVDPQEQGWLDSVDASRGQRRPRNDQVNYSL